MDAGEFVSAIEEYVLKSAVKGTISILTKPPGREVAADLAARSEWFNGLLEAESEMVRAVISDTAYSAVFGFFAVLDRARVIDDEKGNFELYYVGRKKTLLNPPNVALRDFLS